MASFLLLSCPLTSIRYIHDYPDSNTLQIWNSIRPRVNVCLRTLDRYKKDGVYACRLVGAGLFPFMFLDETFLLSYKCLGSFYFLVLMACARIRPLLRELKGPSCGGLARLIRWPTGMNISKQCCSEDLISWLDSMYGTLIKSELIPAISYLRTTYPLKVSFFFPAAFLETFCVNGELDCTNLMATDLFFDSIYLYK